MPYKSLRDFMKRLEAAGRLWRQLCAVSQDQGAIRSDQLLPAQPEHHPIALVICTGNRATAFYGENL